MSDLDTQIAATENRVLNARSIGGARMLHDRLDKLRERKQHRDFLAALPVPALDAPVDWEAFRMDQGWPTPIHMRLAADALDQLVIPKYGSILRWVADACDRALQARAAELKHGHLLRLPENVDPLTDREYLRIEAYNDRIYRQIEAAALREGETP